MSVKDNVPHLVFDFTMTVNLKLYLSEAHKDSSVFNMK